MTWTNHESKLEEALECLQGKGFDKEIHVIRSVFSLYRQGKGFDNHQFLTTTTKLERDIEQVLGLTSE